MKLTARLTTILLGTCSIAAGVVCLLDYQRYCPWWTCLFDDLVQAQGVGVFFVVAGAIALLIAVGSSLEAGD